MPPSCSFTTCDPRYRSCSRASNGCGTTPAAKTSSKSPTEKRTRIFEPYSAEGLLSATGYESSGLGLAFCRLAVEAQGGAIRVEDGTPRGSVFVLELPR